MKILACFTAAILFILVGINAVSAQETKGKYIRTKTHQGRSENADNYKTAENPKSNWHPLRFQSIDAKNVYFQINPNRAVFTVEF